MKLVDVATFIKSSNAGASYLTFDIGFPDHERFEEVVSSQVLTPALIAGLYRIAPEDVRIFAYAPSAAIKITIPRPVMSGGLAERDFDGVQQFAPLLDVEGPWRVRAGAAPAV
jgi:hypothetical protein